MHICFLPFVKIHFISIDRHRAEHSQPNEYRYRMRDVMKNIATTLQQQQQQQQTAIIIRITIVVMMSTKTGRSSLDLDEKN